MCLYKGHYYVGKNHHRYCCRCYCYRYYRMNRARVQAATAASMGAKSEEFLWSSFCTAVVVAFSSLSKTLMFSFIDPQVESWDVFLGSSF